MKNKGSSKFSFLFVWIPLFLLYFSSELVLRVYYVYGEGKTKEELEALAQKLPAFMRDSLKARERMEGTRKSLTDAINSKDKNRIIKAYFDHSGELDEDDRIQLFKELLKQYPSEPKVSRAWVAVTTENGKKYNFNSFLNYTKKLDRNTQARLMNSIWHKVKEYSNEIKKKYMETVLKEKYESGDFYLIYNDLQSVAFKMKMSLEIDQALGDLKAKSFVKYQKQMKKNNKKKKE
jgi:hypothetical protein